MTNIELVGIEFFSPFNKNACTVCGDCFSKCPVMSLSKDVSIESTRIAVLVPKLKERKPTKF